MASHWGNEGQVKLGANAVAEVTAFSLETSVTPVDDTAMGDSWKTHIASSGHKEWSGSVSCHWDETDTNGQEALTEAASVTLNLYPEGSTTGDKYFTGTATVTNISYDVQMDGTVKAEFTFLGNGALSRSTVA